MSKIAGLAVSPKDKEYIFGKCIELAELEEGKDYGADYEDKLLSIAARFVTPKNREVLENAISRFDGTRGLFSRKSTVNPQLIFLKKQV
jgi:hypothetical protein